VQCARRAASGQLLSVPSVRTIRIRPAAGGMNQDHPDIEDALARVDALRTEIEEERPIDPDRLGLAMQRLRLEWTYHSNAIEGNSYGYGETLALLMEGVTAHGKPLKDALDIQRHREVLSYLEGVVHGEEFLSLSDIRGMHRMLMGESYTVIVERPDGTRGPREERGGAFKQHPNHVLTPTGEVHYYATPVQTPALMQDLVDWYRGEWPKVERGELHPVLFAGDFHHRFVYIHPFADGNGRLGRILMNLILMRRGYVPAVFRQERKGAYYAALNQADIGDIVPITLFVAEEITATMQLFLSALRGEPDPKAFDRRLAILEHEINTTVPRPEEPRPIILARFATQFVLPLIFRVSDRVVGLGRLFGHVAEVFLTTNSEGKQTLERQNLEEGDWASFVNQWQLTGFNADPSFSISIRITGTAGNADFSLQFVMSPITSKSHFQRSYSLEFPPPLSEAYQVADDIADIALMTIDNRFREKDQTSG
jgi:Fic family protein